MPNLNIQNFNKYPIFSPNLSGAHGLGVSKTSLHRGLDKIFSLFVVGVLVISSAQLSMSRYLATSSTQATNTQPVLSPTAQPKNTPVAETPNNVNTATAAQTDSSELQAIIDQWQKDYPSGKYGVVAQELGFGKRSAQLNPDTQFAAASLYKIYLADYIYHLVGQGKLSYGQTLYGMPNNVGNCLRLMIVVSDNACGESLGYALGWPSLHNFVRSQGFNKTIMSPVNVVTATDLAKYLVKLNDGSLLNNSENQAQLIGYMKIQIYRYGIPAGVPGVTVADKVGTNPGIYNDAAIVFEPKSNYVLVVLSNNSSTAAIKDLSKRVNNYFKQ